MRWLQRLKLPKVRLNEPRQTTSSVIELAGVGCLVGAAWWWIPVVGLVSLGIALFLVGRAID
jgi:hypothetical protein